MRFKNAFLTSTIFLLSFTVFNSCNNDSGVNGPVGGTVLDQAKAGTVLTPVTPIAGVTNASLQVVSVEDGISNVKMKAVVTNPAIKAIAQFQNQYCTINGDTISSNFGARVTSEGIQLVIDGKNSTIVKFGDGVGTKYTSEITNYTRDIVSKSTTDDYSYGFMNIKVTKVEEQLMVGGSKVIIYFYTNHKFGLVGLELNFEDGTKLKTNL